MFAEAKVTWMVRDVERSVRFYTETLGLPLRSREGEDAAELDAGGLCLRLHRTRPEIPGDGSGNAALGLEVADVEAVRAILTSRGASIGRVLTTGHGSMALFDDPDGNHLYLFQRHGAPGAPTRPTGVPTGRGPDR
jgi:catechol 2,3-dioxygenase-like lactoylglutathione lyase family enzyme